MHFNCTLLLDRVYALLGIIDPQEREIIEVGYPDQNELAAVSSQRLSRVYTQAAMYSFIYHSLEKLHSGFVQERSHDIPSWVPDWSQAEEHISLFNWPRSGDNCSILLKHKFWDNIKFSGPKYELQGDKTCYLVELPEVDSNGVELSGKRELRVIGLIMDTIKYCSQNTVIPMYRGEDLNQYEEVRNERLKKTVQMCHRWEAYTKSLAITAYTNEDGRYEAFWRTLVVDRTLNWQEQAPAEWGALFEIWMGPRDTDLKDAPATRREAMFPFYAPAITRCMSRSFVVTENGYFGLAPGRCREGDFVCLLKGGTTPFIVRASGERIAQARYRAPVGTKEGDTGGEEQKEKPATRKVEKLYTFIGESYVHGIMNGELLEDETSVVQELWLV